MRAEEREQLDDVIKKQEKERKCAGERNKAVKVNDTKGVEGKRKASTSKIKICTSHRAIIQGTRQNKGSNLVINQCIKDYFKY